MRSCSQEYGVALFFFFFFLKNADDISESIKFIKPIENSQPMNETTSNRIEETELTTL